MGVPTSIVQELDKTLGITGQPYQIMGKSTQLDTGYMAWSIPFPTAKPLPIRSEEFMKADKRIKKLLQNDPSRYSDEAVEKYNAFFAQEPVHLQEERAHFVEQARADSAEFMNVLAKRASIFWSVRQILQGAPVIVYKGNISWDDVTTLSFGSIVVAPTTDQFEPLRVEQVEGVNYRLNTQDVVAKLQMLDNQFGISITGAGPAGVEFLLKRIPQDGEARELGQWLFKFAPDIFEAPTSFPTGTVALYWD